MKPTPEKVKADKLRRTGRTSRMLADAKRLDKEGRAVYVIADNKQDRRRLELLIGADTGIQVETPETLGHLDWNTLRCPGMHPNCAVLIDHHVIEDRFGGLLEMLHRYDS